MAWLSALALLLASLSLTLTAGASDYHSPRTDALGGAGHASPLLADAIYLNPSFGSFTRVHDLSFSYLTYRGGQITSPQGLSDYYGHNINLTVLDGTTESLFQAGVGYTRRDDASFIHVGASKNFLTRYGAGLGTKFIFPNDNSGAQIIDGTLSLSGLFTDWLQTAIVVDNLLESAQNQGYYREWILGTKFNVMSILLIYLDPHWIPSLTAKQTQFGYEAGVEFPFFSQVFLRVGKFKTSKIPYQNQYGDGFGVGLGWLAPKLSLDYSFSQVTTPIESNSHNFAMSVYF